MSTEAPLTNKDTAVLAGSVNTSNGTGSGTVVTSLRRILSPKSWVEYEVGAGNGLSFTARAYRSLSQRVFCTCGLMTVSKRRPGGMLFRPGLFATFGSQLDKNTVGYFTWKAGLTSGVSSKLVRDTQYGNFSGTIHLGIPHSFVSLNGVKKFDGDGLKLKASFQFGTYGGSFEYGVVKKISKFSFLGASMSIGAPTGVILKIRLTRSNQIYNFPIHLCEEIIPSAIFYGTLVPVGCYFVISKLILDPYKKRQKILELEKQKELYKTELVKKRREAEAAIELMRATYDRIVAEEESKKGLVIINALYGRLLGDYDERAPDIICTTIPLQCLVKDSKLILHENSKVQLPGFFDPCLGEDKQLKVSYLFHGAHHDVTIADNEGLRIPRQSHRVSEISGLLPS
ncbi:hypothetical protein QYM36_000092 [Artemia franciscana]|nr:hypothetical protein QYM36_000092 [Artemia franciscana]